MTKVHNTLYQTQAIKELERLAMEQQQLADITLMERAGAAAWQLLQQQWPEAQRIAVFCGKGNNGGDGYVLARLAKQQQFTVTVYQLAPLEQLQAAALTAAKACLEAGVDIQLFKPGINISADVIVDALLGTGVDGELGDNYQQAIHTINNSRVAVLALDVPSGLIANTGNVLDEAVAATITLSFIGLKTGLFTGQGPAYCGRVYCDDLDISRDIFAQVTPSASLLSAEEVTAALPARKKNSHKGDFGHVLVIGGDYGMPGAARMAAEAAARVGAGLVTVATHPEHVAVINSTRPELMGYGIQSKTDLQRLLPKATVIIIGPGLGQSAWSQELFACALATDVPKIIDADALNLLAKNPQQQEHFILTPHPGEAARLLNMTTAQIQADRFTAAALLQKRYGGVCVLKGLGTIVQGIYPLTGVCAAGNPGMASGGMGDVLSGVIGGLVAQKLILDNAARVGVFLHSQAADQAAQEHGERGLLASDLMPYLQRFVNLKLCKH